VPPLTNGTPGVTTRYWDCCKPSCGWTANAQSAGANATKTCGSDGSSSVGVDVQSSCNGGSAFQCFWGAPWSVSNTLSYGFAAFNGNNCGKCYQLDFTGTGATTAAAALKGKSMIVQAVNIGDIGANHFDLLIPGGGVGQFATGCATQFAGKNIGATSGGMLTTCKGDATCVTNMCNAAFSGKAQMLQGCLWFANWFGAADNPNIVYKEVTCPAALKSVSGM
jgi:hypothetical protein